MLKSRRLRGEAASPKSEWVRRALKESLLREGSETKTNPVERMAALACPISEIYSILEEIDEGRR